MFEDPAVVWGPLTSTPTTNYLYQVQQAAYQPNAVFVEEYHPRFFPGDTVQRTAHLFNDRPATNRPILAWSAGGARQSQAVTLPPAGQWSGPSPFRSRASRAVSFQLQVQRCHQPCFHEPLTPAPPCRAAR